MKLCAAPRCATRIETCLLMCRRHWFMLSARQRDDVYRTLRAWEMSGAPARDYVKAVADAQLTIAKLEERSPELIAAIEDEIRKLDEKGGEA
jgi:hypothetical protein